MVDEEGEAGSLGLDPTRSCGGAWFQIGSIPVSRVSHGLPWKVFDTCLPSTINLAICFPLHMTPLYHFSLSTWISLARWRGRRSLWGTAGVGEKLAPSMALPRSLLGLLTWGFPEMPLNLEVDITSIIEFVVFINRSENGWPNESSSHRQQYSPWCVLNSWSTFITSIAGPQRILQSQGMCRADCKKTWK